MVDEHVRNMTEVALLYESVSTNNKVKEDARNEIAAKKVRAAQVREASKVRQVRKRDFMEEGSDQKEGNTSPRKNITHALKNQFAKEVENKLRGLKEKAEEFRAPIHEKAERGRINSQQQSDFNRKVDTPIDTTQDTKTTIEKPIDKCIQSTLRQKITNCLMKVFF